MKRNFLLLIFFISFLFPLISQEMGELEFFNKPQKDILLAMGSLAGKTVFSDDTVTDDASFYYSGGTFEEAFTLFLTQNQLYYTIDDGIYYVSRINIECDEELDRISLDCEDVYIQDLIKMLSRKTSRTILFDALPMEKNSFHLKKQDLESILNIVIKRYDEYRLETEDDYFYIKFQVSEMAGMGTSGTDSVEFLRKEGDRYDLNAPQVRFRDLIKELFMQENVEFSLLGRNDSMLESLYFKNKSFTELLKLILEQADSEYAYVGNIYYIIDSQRQDILQKLQTTVYLPIQYITAEIVNELLPSALNKSQVLRMDKRNNAVILHGSIGEIRSIQEFIESIDKPLLEQKYYRYGFSYLQPEEVAQILPESLENITLIPIPDTDSSVVVMHPGLVSEWEEYINVIDRKDPVYPIHLKYIKSEELMESLPPSVSEEDIITTRDSSLIFLKGDTNKLGSFQEELKLVDKPIPQIRYDLLVIQYQDNQQFNWDPSESTTNEPESTTVENDDGTTEVVETALEETAPVLVGALGNVMSLSFDVTSAFGYQFALGLDTDLSQSKARVLADTTMNAISGEQVKFQNTNTYRYRDTVTDTDTGDEEVTGVSREITSGLFINISGWVSGNSMITMEISTTVSKQEAISGSSDAGTLPPTSEKIVETQIRTMAGKPVVIGGLIQQEKTETVQKVPFLGDIPLLGALFQSRQENLENTEMVIYIIPHIESEDQNQFYSEARIQRYIKKYGDLLKDEED